MKIQKITVELLRNSAVAVMPSDTVYGLMCSALQPIAVRRMYDIKRRDRKPGTIIAASTRQLVDMGFDYTEVAQASKFWPDAVSVILNAPDELEYLHMGKGSLAVRIPKPEWLRELLRETGPLATTSANFPDQPTVTTIAEAKQLFGDLVDLYIDGDTIVGATHSSVIRVHTDGTIEKLR